SPARLHLQGVELRLRFGPEGWLLSKLPTMQQQSNAAMPTIDLEGARLVLLQEGRSPFPLEGISGRVRPTKDGGDLEGVLDDPVWGRWTISGRFSTVKRSSSFRMRAESVAISTEMLRTLPFLSPATWDVVQPSTSGPVEVALSVGMKSPYLNYRLAF